MVDFIKTLFFFYSTFKISLQWQELPLLIIFRFQMKRMGKPNQIISDIKISTRIFINRFLRMRKLRHSGFHLGKNQTVVNPSYLKIDIVIPAIEKDLDTLPYVIDFARKNVLHPVTNVYVVSPDSEKIKKVCSDKNCIYIFEENLLPIKKSDIDYRVGTLDRSGWMYQQFLKLSGNHFCTEENYLVLDSDTLLIKPQVFERDGKYIFNFSDEYHKPYFDVYERLLGYPVSAPVSLTSHHILINMNKLSQLKSDLESKNGLVWYNAILHAIDRSEPSSHSDYDTYGHYFLGSMKDSVYLEYWYNRSIRRQFISDAYKLSNIYQKKFKSLSFHSWNN